tara:strand:+ start:539 stop:1078 length:540 start_codon:yes stop_codon:yes gene_type:complete
MGKKDQLKESDDEFLDSLYQSTQTSTTEHVIYYIQAIVVAAVPVYLYATVYDMSLDEFKILYGVVTLVATYLLGYSYKNTARNVRVELSQERDHLLTNKVVLQEVGKKGKKEDLQKQQDAVTAREAASYSLWTVSAYFLATVLFMSFFIFARATAPYNYALSVSASAALWSVVSMGNTK